MKGVLSGDSLDGLVLYREAGGFRHYLADEPDHAGDAIEALSDGGTWVVVRYEWTFCEADEPALVLDGDRVLPHRANASYRWPAKRLKRF